jgi:23S rRNA pseudouridine1911/1915/1917 synthase
LKQSGLIISSDAKAKQAHAGGDIKASLATVDASVVAEIDAEQDADMDAEVESRSFSISPGLHGHRLDHALVENIPELSRSYLQQLIQAGAVSLNGRLALKASAKVKAGDLGTIEIRPTAQSQAFKPELMPLDVVYQDVHLLVINKPAGLVVHPAPGNWSGTLLNGLLAHDPQAASLPRAGIVHRLDKDTSGLMVVARTRSVMDALVKKIAAREVSRQYLAVAHGAWLGSTKRDVDAPVGRDPRNRLRMAVVNLQSHAGKPAKTSFRLLAQSNEATACCLVQCILHTGRTHQIRVHMASIGHPLVADAVYGGKVHGGLQRQALHAWRLAFEHPADSKYLSFESPLPGDMQAALPLLGLRYNESLASEV